MERVKVMESKELKPWKTDVPVLCIFFARPEVFEKTFAAVKEARPKVLLLWQDGPRNERDMENIQKCREIAEDIDWECEVHKNYHTENMGCDPSTFLSHKWAFSIVDKCIVLEDDMVTSPQFFLFCKEMLDKYEFDERINHICGANFLGEYKDCPYDYLFSFYGTGAWASWKRVADGWDDTYGFMNDKYFLKNARNRDPALFDGAYKAALWKSKSGKEWWEVILGFDCILNNRLVIIPKRNLITNIGVTEGATHGTSLKMMNKRVRNTFNMKPYDMTFPLNHPRYVVPDYGFMNEMTKINCKGRPLLKKLRKMEYLLKTIFYGDFFRILKRKIKRK